MWTQRIVTGRLRTLGWVTCLSMLTALGGCGGGAMTTPGEGAVAVTAQQSGAQTQPVENTGGLPLPAAMADLSLTPLSKQQMQLANEPLKDVLSRITEPKSAAEDQQPDSDALRAYAEARQAYDARDYRRSLEAVERAIKLDDRFGQPYELLGRLNQELGQEQKMLDAMGEAVKRDPHCVTGLFVLGLSARDQGQLGKAIDMFGRAYRVDDRPIDPGMKYMVDFELGRALLQSGRVAAAEQAMAVYLRQAGGFQRSTTMPRQVYLADVRKDAVLMLLGDAHLRMGDVAGARERYLQARKAEDQPDTSVIARRIYTALRLKQFEEAERIALDTLTKGEDASAALELAKYVAAHTDDRARFTKKLTDWYEQSQRDGRMAIAVAQVMQPEEADAFLTGHIAHSPADLRAYRALVKLYGATPDGRAKTATLTTQLIGKHPEQARQYVSAMLETNLTYEQWDAALKARPDADRYSAAGWFLQGMIESQARHMEQAGDAMAKSLNRDPDFVPAQAATITGEISAGNYEQALRMIEGSAGKDQPALQLLKAVALSRSGDTGRAIQTLQPLVDQYPQNNEYLLAMSQLQRAQRDFDAAERTGRQMLTNDPTHEDAYELLFRIYETDRPDATKFTQLLAKARATIPNAAVTWRELARYHLMRNEEDQAEKVLRQLVRQYPKDAAGLRDLVSLLARGGRLKDAQTLLTGQLDKDPLNGPAMDLLRQVARELDDPEVFYQRLEIFLNRLEPSVDNYLQLAALYDRWHKPVKGIDAINKALAMRPADVVPLYAQLCRLYEQQRQFGKAEQAIDKAIAAAGDRPALYAIKAWLLHEARQDDRAVKVMTDAIAKFPPDQANDLRRELARLYTAANQIDLAMAQIDRMVASDPGSAADIYADQAMALAAKGDATQLTEQLLLKALKADPDHVSANNNLGYQWADEGINLARAERMIRKAVKAQPDQPAYMDSMGWVLYKLGRFDEAVTWLNRAIRQPGGNDPVVLDHLADALWRAGQHDQAKKIWKDALAALEKEAARAAQFGQDGQDAISPEHVKLLPALKGRLKAVESGLEPDLPPVPDHVVETVPPAPPPQQMQ